MPSQPNTIPDLLPHQYYLKIHDIGPIATLMALVNARVWIETLAGRPTPFLEHGEALRKIIENGRFNRHYDIEIGIDTKLLRDAGILDATDYDQRYGPKASLMIIQHLVDTAQNEPAWQNRARDERMEVNFTLARYIIDQAMLSLSSSMPTRQLGTSQTDKPPTYQPPDAESSNGR